MDTGVELIIIDSLTTGDLKYHDCISLIMGSKRTKALADGARMLDGNKGPGDNVGATTIGDARIRILAIFVAILVFAFFYT